VKVYIKNPTIQGAWMWIQKGYKLAWESLGYDVEYYNSLSEISESEYILMTREWDVKSSRDLETIERAKLSFLFAQPQIFPPPWGTHPNFISSASDDIIKQVNQMEHVYLWTFGYVNPSYHHKWKEVNTVFLAFDSISYTPIKEDKYTKYDICFVGGWANNGFNEKRKIMIESFSAFQQSGLNCGFFINKNLSHEQETALLYNSKISLNMHDAYQRALGMDTNERTFKSLGLNGLLISDKVTQLEDIFPNTKTSNDPTELVSLTKEYLSLTEKERNNIKEENRQNILNNHCYTNRVEQLLSLENNT